jgi:signal transduction histidine kinase
MEPSFHEMAPSRAPGVNPEAPDEDDRRILVVDDEEAIRQCFANFLGGDYSCATAGSAEEALLRLKTESFSLVIVDVIMPGLSGIELLRKATELYPDTAVIMVSGVDRTQRVMDAMRLGAFDYLTKPCDLDVLEFSVKRALERRTLLRDTRRYKQDLEQRNQELTLRKAELERLQAGIVHSEKMASLGQLVAGIAHELNNPAGFLHGNMEMLRECFAGLERLMSVYDDASLPPGLAARAAAVKEETGYENTLKDLRSIIDDCREGAVRIRDVVRNLRTFSRLDEAEFKKVDIHEGIDSTFRLLSRYYSSEHITRRRDYGELPLVDCYAGQLNQVWMNLLVNAAQAVGAGVGEVCIRTRLEKEMVIVTISDTGCGIEPEHLSKIFDPFFTTKPVGEGTGLGLSTTYGIVERHGGSISVESCADLGTTFTVMIPAAGKPRGPERGEEDALHQAPTHHKRSSR